MHPDAHALRPLPAHPPLRPDRQALAGLLADWRIDDVECALGDFTSLARGKRLRASDFLAATGCRVPTVMLGMGLTGGSPMEVFGSILPQAYQDLQLVPDATSLRRRPGRRREATVLCEPAGQWHAPRYGRLLQAAELSPRAALRRVLQAYAAQGLAVKAAPEMEFFLLSRQPEGLGSARPWRDAPVQETACEQYSLERTSHFDAYFDELYGAADTLGIPLAGHLHEAAFSQFEVNFHPGEPLAQADAVFRFKRLAREVAARHGFLASFAAKPFLDQPGTGMHWHFSVQRTGADWPHLFAQPDGRSSPELLHFLAGLQAGGPAAMAWAAPHDMSFDRVRHSDSSPTHADWGEDDRHAAFRVPASDAAGRRVENRLPGGDANPYLVVAATLALGLDGLQAGQPARAGRDAAPALPRSLPAALDALAGSDALRRWFGDPLIDLFVALQRHEHHERHATEDPRAAWDLRHLIELA